MVFLVLSCRSPQFATRVTLLSTEALKSKGMYAEAATQLIKMTSEVCDHLEFDGGFLYCLDPF